MKEEKYIIKLLNDFFYNRIQAEDVEEVIRKLGDENYRFVTEKVMKEQWHDKNHFDMLSESEFDVILNMIHHRTNLIDERKSKGISRRLFIYLSRVAAILFIPLVFATSYLFVKNFHDIDKGVAVRFNEIYTPMAAKTRFLLPDSTVVWLNSGSTLKYPMAFTGKRREVYLSGEGYFDVIKNVQKPFIVKTEKLDITALGTAFDVMAYPDDPVARTTLVNGNVEVFQKMTGQKVDLKPSLQAVSNISTGETSVSKVDTRYYVSWKDGKLIFKSEPMEVVARQLERWFNCKIHLEGEQLKKYKYTGTIEMETLREVLELIKITTPIQYTYDKNTREIWINPK